METENQSMGARITRARVTRRRFVQTSAQAAAATWLAARCATRVRAASPNDDLRFAAIGVGGKGASLTREAAEAGRLVAICDVDENQLDKAAGKFPGVARYHDFRQMLETERSRIDAVAISTPNHTHAAPAVMAMSMGKHCFC